MIIAIDNMNAAARMATAIFLFCVISRHRLLGVSRSITMKEITKMRIPKKE